jgi:hypothetical protein
MIPGSGSWRWRMFMQERIEGRREGRREKGMRKEHTFFCMARKASERRNSAGDCLRRMLLMDGRLSKLWSFSGFRAILIPPPVGSLSSSLDLPHARVPRSNQNTGNWASRNHSFQIRRQQLQGCRPLYCLLFCCSVLFATANPLPYPSAK